MSTTGDILAALRVLVDSEGGKRRGKFLDSFIAAMKASDNFLYLKFEEYALAAVAAGRTRIGAELLFNRMRWYTQVEGRGSDTTFRLNNNFKAFLARLFIILHPEHDGLFEMREDKADREQEGEQ